MFGLSARDYRVQVAVSLSILVGLFFVEYPPIFLLGYWSWGALPHKVLSGVLVALNLLITQQATKRLGFFRNTSRLMER
jgi:hypothetical protein